jgi:hypothetical protein
MSTPGFSSEEDCHCCKSYIVASIEAIKALHVTATSLMVEVAALRQTLQSDPQLAERYARFLDKASLTAKPLLDTAVNSYDEMIERVKHSQGWPN